MCAKFLNIEKYPLALVGNMDKTPIFFDIVTNKFFPKEGYKSVKIRIFGYEKTRDSCSNPGKLIELLKILLFLITSVLSPRKRLE